MLYGLLKCLHLLGAVILIGNVTITAFWKVFADRTGDRRTIVFAQDMVVLTDWVFTLGGIVLVLVGGYGMVIVGGHDPFGSAWLIAGQVLFAVAGLIWLIILIPSQTRAVRLLRAAEADAGPLQVYRAEARHWIVWGIIATLPLLAALAVMVLKP